MKDIIVDGYKTVNSDAYDSTIANSFITDSSRTTVASEFMEDGRGLNVEDCTFKNITVYYNDMIAVHNMWLNNVVIDNCEATAINTGNRYNLYYDILKKRVPSITEVVTYSFDKYYQCLSSVSITNCLSKGAINTVYTSEKEKGVITDGSILYKDVRIENNLFRNYILNYTNTTAYGNHLVPTFDGTNYLSNNEMGIEGEQSMFAIRFNRDPIDSNPATADFYDYSIYGDYMARFKNNSKTYITNNTMICGDTSDHIMNRAMLYFVGGKIDLSGHLEVVNNKFQNMAQAALNDSLYYETYVTAGILMAGMRSQFNLGTASILCKDNKGYLTPTSQALNPEIGWTMQIFVQNYTSYADDRQSRLNTPIFLQKTGTKFIASRSTVYIHTHWTSLVKNSTFAIYKGWCGDNVAEYSTKYDRMLKNCIMVDPALNGNSSLDNRQVYIAGQDQDCMVYIGSNYIKAYFSIYDEARVTPVLDPSLTQNIGLGQDSKGNNVPIKTNIEMPVEEFGNERFWVGPTDNFLNNNSTEYHKYCVLKRDFLPQHVTMDQDFYIYGYKVEPHRHPLAIGLTTEDEDYWVQAGRAAGPDPDHPIYDTNDVLNRRYHSLTDATHLQSQDAKIYLMTDLWFDEERFATLSNAYSICLNGHNLTLTKKNLVQIKESGINIYVTDCTGNGKILFRQADSTDKDYPIAFDITNGSINLSNISLESFDNTKLYEPYVYVNGDGRINTANLTVANITYSENSEFTGLFQIGNRGTDKTASPAMAYWNPSQTPGGTTPSITFRDINTQGQYASVLKINNVDNVEMSNVLFENCNLANNSKGIVLSNIENLTIKDETLFRGNVAGTTEAALILAEKDVHSLQVLGNAEFCNNGGNSIVMTENCNGALTVGDINDTEKAKRFYNNMNSSTYTNSKNNAVIVCRNKGFTNNFYNTIFESNGNLFLIDKSNINIHNSEIKGDANSKQGMFVFRYISDSTDQASIRISSSSITNNYLDKFDGHMPNGVNQEKALTTIYLNGVVNITNNEALIDGARKDMDIFMHNEQNLIFSVAQGDFLDSDSRIRVAPFGAGAYGEQPVFNKWNETYVEGYAKGVDCSQIFMYSEHSVKDYLNDGYHIYRKNDYVYSGLAFDKVSVYFIDNTSNVFDGQQPIHYYISNTEPDLKIAPPVISTAGFAAQGRTFLGYVGRSNKANNEFVPWDFDNDTFVGSKYPGSPNLPYMRELFAVVSDDTMKRTACGSDTADTTNHKDGTRHELRGGAPSDSAEAHYKNFIPVSTLPQLMYKYKSGNDLYNTQYYLANDITFGRNMTSIKGKMVLLLEGHTINIESSENPVFDFDEDLEPIYYQDEKGGSIAGGTATQRGVIIATNNNLLSSTLFKMTDISSTKNYNHLSLYNLDISVNMPKVVTNQKHIIDLKSDYRNSASLLLENVHFDKGAIQGDIIHTEGIKNIYIENSSIEENTIEGNAINIVGNSSSNATINLYGDNNFNKNKLNSYIMFNLDKVDVIAASGSNTQLNENNVHIYEYNLKQYAHVLSMNESNLYLYGSSFTVEKNKFIETSDTLEVKLSTLLFNSNNNTITISDGSVKIKEGATDTRNLKAYGLYVTGTQVDTLINQVANTQIDAQNVEFDISFENTAGLFELYDGWYYDKVKKYNDTVACVTQITTVSNMHGTFKAIAISNSDKNMVVYKSGVGNDCNVYMGLKSNTTTINIYERKDKGDELIDIQYIAKSKKTSLERIPLFNDNIYSWRGPHEDGINGYYRDGEVLPNTTKLILFVSDEYANIVGERTIGGHDHIPGIGFKIDTATVSFMSAGTSTDLLGTDYNYLYLISDITMKKEDMVKWANQNKEVFSICLNGHKLIFEEGVTFFDITNKNMRFYITDCTAHNAGGATHTNDVLNADSWGALSNIQDTHSDVPSIIATTGNVYLSNFKLTNINSTVLDISGAKNVEMLGVTIRQNTTLQHPIITAKKGNETVLNLDGIEVYNNRLNNNVSSGVPIFDINKIKKVNYKKVVVKDTYTYNSQVFKLTDISDGIFVEGGRYTDNVSNLTGSGIFYVGGNVKELKVFGDVQFTGNRVKGSTKGIAFNTDFEGRFDIEGTQDENGVMMYPNFIGNYDTGYANNQGSLGGAIYIGNKETILNISTNSVFKENKAYGGGSIYTTAKINNIYNIVAENNVAVNGGFINTTNGSLNIYNTTFVGNNASRAGGVIFADSSINQTNASIILDNVNMNANYIYSLSSLFVGGGVIYVKGYERNKKAVLKIQNNTTFTSNYVGGMQGIKGSVIYLDDYSDLIAKNALFSNNYANNNGIGGIYRANAEGNLLIEDSSFIGNRAFTGAIYDSIQSISSISCISTFSRVTINGNNYDTRNNAQTALINLDGNYETLYIDNCEISGNLIQATNYGCIIRNAGEEAGYYIKNTTFNNNGNANIYYLISMQGIDKDNKALLEDLTFTNNTGKALIYVEGDDTKANYLKVNNIIANKTI